MNSLGVSWFQADKIAEELESKSGFYFLANPFKENELAQNPKEIFLTLAKLLGTPVSQSTAGELVLDIKDQSLSQNDSQARGPYSNKKLGFHTDRCDVIAFLCLQPAFSGGENQIVSSVEVEKIIHNERPDLHAVLSLSFPYKRHVMDSANPRPYIMQPIFSSERGYFACSYLRVLIDRANQDPQCPNLSEIQIQALDFLDTVCERQNIQTRLTLRRGDLLFLNNWTTLHRRTAFVDEKQERFKRHLLRIWLSMPNSRPLDQSFKDNFGSVEAGEVRGGIRTSDNKT